MIPMPHLRIARLACSLGAPLGLLAAAATLACGADLRPSWECLPSETLAVVRVPDGRGFVDALTARTKFGGVMLGPERWQRIRERFSDVLAAGANGEALEESLEKMSAKLESYGFDAGDAAHAFDGEAGLALVSGAQPQTEPVLIGWLEPGEAAAERMLAGIGRLYEDAAAQAGDQPFPMQRVDLDMAGRSVMSVQLPVVKDGRLLANAHLLVTRIGGRLLGAILLEKKRWANVTAGIRVNPKSPQSGMQPTIEIKERDFTEAEAADAQQGFEAARGVFERFLARHDDAGEAAVAEWLDVPGMRAAMPGGIPMVELLVRPMGTPDGNPLHAVLARFGLDSLGPMVWRQSLDGDAWRSHVFVSLPTPRHGLARILDEPSDAGTVPSFVTREPTTFRQMSVDLGALYSMIREAVLDGEEPPPGNIFDALESQSLAMLGAQLPAVLSAFGSRHWMVLYPWNIAEEIAELRRLKLAGEGGGEGKDEGAGNSPMAIVWEVTDEAPFEKLVQMAAAATGGEPKDEQGFRTVRLPGGLSVALGQKHLVVAMGEGVAEKTLAAIRNPPAAESSLAGSEVERRAHELLPPEAGGFYSLGDERHTGGSIGTFGALVAAIEPDDLVDGSASNRAFLALMKALFPTPTEIEGAIGATTTLWRATDDGILLRSVSELPAP